MSKAKIFLEIEVDINNSAANDRERELTDIAETVCGGIVCGIQDKLISNKRKPKVTKAAYEYLTKGSFVG